MSSALTWGLRALLTLPVLLVFQNCVLKTDALTEEPVATQMDPKKTSAGLVQTGGGDGYDGKLFFNRLLEGQCSDGSDIRSIVGLRKDGIAETLRRDCQDEVAPVAIAASKFSFMPHNVNNLIFESQTFDVDVKISKDPRLTEWLCRGSELAAYYRIFHGVNLPPTWFDRWGDLILKPNATGFSARFKAALYEQGSFSVLKSEVLDSGEFHVDLEVGPQYVISGNLPGGSHISTMLVPTSSNTLIGKFSFSTTPETAPPGFENFPTFFMNLTCYAQ